MRRCWLAVLLAWVLGAAGMALGQSPAQGPVTQPVFEVASVRLSPPGGDGMSSIHLYEGPEITLRNVSLRFLLQVAYGVLDYQIAGTPKWADSAQYDVLAKTDGTIALTHEQLKPLMQKLLVERLHLTVHREMKDFKGYRLVVAKGEPKLNVSKGVGAMAQILPDGLQAWNVDMGHFALLLGSATRRPVIDKTGVVGKYDIDLAYSPAGTEDFSLPSLFTVLQEKMGLRLDAQMVPLEMLVVDSVERMPVEN